MIGNNILSKTFSLTVKQNNAHSAQNEQNFNMLIVKQSGSKQQILLLNNSQRCFEKNYYFLFLFFW